MGVSGHTETLVAKILKKMPSFFETPLFAPEFCKPGLPDQL